MSSEKNNYVKHCGKCGYVVESLAIDNSINAINLKIDNLQLLVQELVSERKRVDGYINQEETEKLTGLSKSTLYKLRKGGELSFSSFGSRDIYYKLSEIEELLKKNEKRL